MNDLYSLIKALNQSEKRFFERYARLQTDSDTRYVKLFRAIQKQSKYNEEKLKKTVGDYLFPQLKQQLLQKLSEAMVLMYTNKGHAHLQHQLLWAQVLQSKELDEFLDKVLQKNIRQSNERFQFTTELEAFSVKHAKLLEGASAELLKEEASVFANRSKVLLQNLNEQIGFESLLLDVSILKEELESVRDVQQQKRVADFLKRPVLQNLKRVQTPFGECAYYYAKGMCYYVMGNFAAAETHFIKLYELSKVISTNNGLLSNLHTKSIANCALTAMQLQKFESAAEYMLELELKATTQKDKARILSLKLIYFNKCGRFNEASQLVKTYDINLLLRELKDLNQEKIYIFFGIVGAYFGMRQYKQASFIVLEFIKTERKGSKHDAYLMARIVYLIIQFELGNEGLVDSELKSVQRILKLKKRKYQFETVFLHFVNHMQVVQSEKEKHNQFKLLYNKLQKLSETPFERNAFAYFDFLGWANSNFE